MSEPPLKCENNTIFQQGYTLKLLIAFKMAYSCCFSFGGNVDFPEFRQKKFITLTNLVNLAYLHWLYVVQQCWTLSLILLVADFEHRIMLTHHTAATEVLTFKFSIKKCMMLFLPLQKSAPFKSSQTPPCCVNFKQLANNSQCDQLGDFSKSSVIIF